MEVIPILIQHSGVWDDDNNFKDFKVNGVLIIPSCTFEVFVADIRKQLRFCTNSSITDIKYFVKEGYPPLSVEDDMSLRFFMELKRSNSDLGQYPLCVSVKKEASTGICFNIDSTPATCEGFNRSSVQDFCIPAAIEMITTGKGEDLEGLTVDIISNPLHEEVAEGQVYRDKKILIKVIRNYAIKEKFQFKVKRSSTTRYSLVCVDENCKWNFKSSSVGTSKLFKVRNINSAHNCSLEERLFAQRHTTSVFIGNLIKDKFADPKSTYLPADIIRDFKKYYGVDLNYMKAWRSKEKAIELIRGNPRESYGNLPKYLYMVRHTNPGSVTELEAPGGIFLYVYVSLYASIKGWNYCRPIVVVDASFLKSTYRGTMITASTLDAAGCILPLAYAVVDSENNASWEWFFKKFRDTFGVREGMCIVSDRHDSILHAASVVYPDVPHCACIFHLWNNIKVQYKRSHKQLKEVFFALAKAYTVEEFDRHMSAVEAIDARVKNYLYNAGYQKWSRAHCITNRYSVMTSNIAESINSANKYARELPIVPLLHSMMLMVQDWNYTNRKDVRETFTKLPSIHEVQMRENFIFARTLTVIPSTDYVFTVCEGNRRQVVNMQQKTCTCKRFQKDEKPCRHALAVVNYNNFFDPYELCSMYYSKEYLTKTYEEPVHPMQDESAWEIPTEISEYVILPPPGKRKVGRPQKNRFPSTWESQVKRSKNTCGRCGQEGHNRKTCRNAPKC